MKVVRGNQIEFQPASHEDPSNPGVLKKVLASRADLFSGQVQMVNVSKMPIGKSFRKHYHEDMQEVFVIVKGKALMTVGGESFTLLPEDAVLVDPLEVHQMSNVGESEVEYIVFGISTEQNGQTILVDDRDSQAPNS